MYWRRLIFAILVTAISTLVAVAPAENIDPYNDDSQYGYSENVGWLDFEPSQGTGVTVTDDEPTGFVWAENIGWINLAPDFGRVINGGTGLLSGFAWAENVGWVNLNPKVPGDLSHYGVTILFLVSINGTD